MADVLGGVVMSWVPVLVAALFLGPLYATGELGVWAFDAPRSNLIWDEAGGADAPQPHDAPGGAAALWGQLALGPVLILLVTLVSRRIK